MDMERLPNLPLPANSVPLEDVGAPPAEAGPGDESSVSSRVALVASSGLVAQAPAQGSDVVPVAQQLSGPLAEKLLIPGADEATKLPDIGTQWRCVALRKDLSGGSQLTFEMNIASSLVEYVNQMNKIFPALEPPIGTVRDLLQFSVNQNGNVVKVFEALGYACDAESITLPDFQYLQNAWGDLVKRLSQESPGGAFLPSSLPIVDAQEGIVDDLRFFEEVKNGRVVLSTKECLHDHPYHVVPLVMGLVMGRSAAPVADGEPQISLWQKKQATLASHLERYQRQVIGFTDALAAGKGPGGDSLTREDIQAQIGLCHAMLGMIADHYSARSLVGEADAFGRNWVDSLPTQADQAIQKIMQGQKRWPGYFAKRFKVDESVVRATIQDLGTWIRETAA